MMRASAQLRELLRGGGVVVAPGVWDGLSARLVARAGFPAAYACARSTAASRPSTARASVRAMRTRSGSVIASRAARSFWAISTTGTTDLSS